MPRLEKLSEQYKNQPDVVFLSMNIDEDPGLIDPFVKQQKLTFTVLPAYSYATDTLKVNGIPQNWIVVDGVVRLKGTGYDATNKWQAGMEKVIEQFRAHGATGAAAPPPSPAALSTPAATRDSASAGSRS